MTEEVHVPRWQKAMARVGGISLHPPQSGLETHVIAGPRHPRVPDLRYLDMMFNWSVHATDGRAMARTECLHVQDTEYAMNFALRAFAYHGWEIERGEVLLCTDTWTVSLVFTHPKLKHGEPGRKRVIEK
jgi:hypothetical protein